MIEQMTFHGTVGDEIEYHATVAGKGIVHRYFYESRESGVDRFFYGGKEFVFGKDRLSHKGNGGTFCEYMFGINQPVKDLVRKDVMNRLAMYGTSLGGESGELVFTDKTDGWHSYDSVFVEGNAVSNYYFFIDADLPDDVRSQQEQMLKLTSKTLKYTPAVGTGLDTDLIAQLNADLDGYNPVIFLFRIVNRYHKRYCELFKELYSEDKEITRERARLLSTLAKEFNIDQYQQERIKIDVIYNHPENKRVIDEYKDILITFENKEEINQSDIAALNRLRALAVRKNIPYFLFDVLNEILLKGKKFTRGTEPLYLKDSRALLNSLFIMEGSGLEDVLDKNDIIKLLVNKKNAMEKRDQTFEALLLEVGQICDEKYQKGNPKALERFSELITYFDRYDTTSSMINGMAFMDEDVTVEKFRSLMGNKTVFEVIRQGLFDTLFTADLLANKYLTFSGRKKVNAMRKCLEDVEKGYSSLSDLAREISVINEEDRSFQLLYKTAKDSLRKIPGAMDGKRSQEVLVKEVLKSLLQDVPSGKVSGANIKKVFTTLKMELFYITELLPEIVETGDMKPREDFLLNSGFDRFFIEDVERDFIETSTLAKEKLGRFWELVGLGGEGQKD